MSALASASPLLLALFVAGVVIAAVGLLLAVFTHRADWLVPLGMAIAMVGFLGGVALSLLELLLRGSR